MSEGKNEKSTDLSTKLGNLAPRVREMLASPENEVFEQGIEFLRSHDASTEDILEFIGLGLDTVYIPKGKFSFQDKIRTLVGDFWMWRTPITEAQWAAVMPHWENANPSSDLPQARVSWDDIQVFLERLNIILAEDGMVADLPHEVEWEYAARAGQNFKYSGSNDPDEVAWYGANSGGRTHPVAQKKPNGWGLYDMSGNVWEWCKNVYHEEVEKVIEDFKAMIRT